MPADTLFSRLGGEAGVARLLDLHYERVVADDHLGEYFMGVDLNRLKTAQLAFLRTAFGEPGARYDTAAIRSAHQDQLVSELAFDGFIDTLVSSAAEIGASTADQDQIRVILKGLRDSVIMSFRPNPAYNYPTKPL